MSRYTTNVSTHLALEDDSGSDRYIMPDSLYFSASVPISVHGDERFDLCSFRNRIELIVGAKLRIQDYKKLNHDK